MATDGPMNDNVVNPLFGKVAPTDVHAAISYLAEDMVITEEEEQELRQALFINKYGESFSSSTTPDEAALNLNIDAARAAWKNTNLEGSPIGDSTINIDGHMYTAQEVIKAYIDYAVQMQNNQGGNTNMANVMFKRGTQAALNTLINGSGDRFDNGCFYLTTDTNRLYVAQSASKLVELNKSITTVTRVDQLPTDGVEIGQFYYVSGTNNGNSADNTHGGNILAVYMGPDAGGWIQVNPDTDTDTKVSSISATAGTTANTYILTVTSVDKNGQNPTSVTAVLPINVTNILNQASLGLDTTTASNQATVNTKLYGSDKINPISSINFSIKGGDNVTVSATSNNVITISSGIGTDSVKGAVESLTANTVKSYVTVNGAQSGDALVINADKALKMTVTTATVANKTVVTSKIEHSTTTPTTSTTSNTTLSTTAATNIISSIEADNYGHVTKIVTTPIKALSFKASSINADSNGNLSFAIADENNSSTGSVTAAGVLKHTITIDGTTSTVYNQGHLGSFWSADALEAKFRTLDAFTYKGVVGKATSTASTQVDLPTSNVENGDAYKVNAGGYDDGSIKANPGDLIIATGTENSTTGYIGNDLAWTVIASGTETDTTYDLVANSSTSGTAELGLIPRTGNGFIESKVPISTDGIITVSATNYDLSNTAYGSISFAHKASGVTSGTYGTTTTKTNATVVIVPQLTVDKYGHITSTTSQTVNLQTYTLKGDNATNELQLQNGSGTKLSGVKFESGTATAVEVSTTAIRYNHATVTATTTSTTAELNIVSDAKTFDVQTITKNDQGHITKIETKTYSLPKINDKLVSSVTSTTTNSVSFSTELQDYNGNNANKGNALAFSLDSTSLQIQKATATNAVSLNLVWGSF